ncbi:methyltransferase domain-containing protein [Acetobacteraceae bacterium KSS8]|uniref:Methyltransferase domain-containing protein n=1 Tax=Endosaccharibacter trunci TaxID=2812733 RepID=A0ABT1W5G1_9PROT|nr:methyltransferase domain-containing protein [Acetobacteraceae bacterium KSS8]
MSGDPGWVKQDTGPETDTGAPATTAGTLLGGRVAYQQYRGAYRTGLEPVLMAAAVPARAGQRVLEAGCGAGAGLLCLGARVAGLHGTGIELDPEMAELARRNLGANGLDWPVLRAALQDADQAGPFHHAFANPPWHRAAATASADPKRDLARRAPPGMLAEWIDALAARLLHRGTLTLALPAGQHAEAASALLRAGFGSLVLHPFWPKAGRPARILLLQAVLGGRGDGVVLPGLTLHRPDGGFTDEAEAVLRHGQALPLR